MKVTRKGNTNHPNIKFPCIMLHNTHPELIIYVLEESEGVYKGIALSHPEIGSWNRKITDWRFDCFNPMREGVLLENE
jgi:hypothetical protein